MYRDTPTHRASAVSVEFREAKFSDQFLMLSLVNILQR